jgi:hypothetical protein
MFTGTDRFVDLALRILTGVILSVLVLALVLLIWNFLKPRMPSAPPVPLVEVEPKPAPKVDPAAPPAAAKGEVLLNPGQVYRCVINGRTTFSEKPCPQSGGGASPPAKR